MPVLGLLTTSLDLVFSKLFEFQFHVTDQMTYGVIGADFLAQHQLSVNFASYRLSETTEVQRCVPDDPWLIPSEYGVSSASSSMCSLFNDLQEEFPEVFDFQKRARSIKHSMVADVETTTDIPIHTTARRLNPEQYKALKVVLSRLLNQGVLKHSQSPWAFPIVIVKKKLGDWRLCADSTKY